MQMQQLAAQAFQLQAAGQLLLPLLAPTAVWTPAMLPLPLLGL
jgi:hypothetical protein